jgi:hypothetical protein
MRAEPNFRHLSLTFFYFLFLFFVKGMISLLPQHFVFFLGKGRTLSLIMFRSMNTSGLAMALCFALAPAI